MAASEASTPPRSRSSSGSLSSRRPSASNLSLDLDSLPPLQQPSPPSNTLIITNLDDPVIFTPANLASIRAAIHNHASLHSFSPLKSFRRIICTFHSEEEAITIRKVLDGESVLGNRVRVYFGEPTRLDTGDQHLAAPQSQKLFFISPPPSPPHGWEMRNEEPPNKDVHADDLAAALSKLHARPAPDEALRSPTEAEMKHAGGRARGSSLSVVYDPADQGHSPDLPAVWVEDTSDSPGLISPIEAKPMLHTARPPVELME